MPLKSVGGNPSTLAGGVSSVKEVFAHREMLDLLIRRDLKARYKDSSLGFVWSLVRPLTQLFIYYVVLGHFLGAARGIPDFAIYIFSGLTAFTLFSEIVLGGASSIVGNSGLVKKVYLPREIFPLASVGSALFNFGIQLVILLIATLALGRFPWHLDLLYFFPAVALILVYGTALGLLLSAANVYLRDIQYLIEVVMMLLMWGSPIVYAWTMVRDTINTAWIVEVYTNNPLTLAVLGFQKAFWLGGPDSSYPSELLLRMGVAFVIGLVLLVVSQRVFNRLQGDFAQAL
ncbi:ABC transporter permease [Compostimonas suwonensis]|uniref:Transport permease protein n=1 Tax=Compostimonas suwonensis TaxID=1048394 RepID=A0A2M9BV36_9MICO|nr:ABC transporter permease [Compostimonas suwonensis]PJJ61742.1 ABC-2 type transport system permease protein [Compostimonas suwonensis]